MKNLFLGCVALLLTFGVSAQPGNPQTFFCPDSSTWDNHECPPENAYVVQPYPCVEVIATQGNFIYFNGANGYNEDFMSLDTGTDMDMWNAVYGLRGRHGIWNESGETLDIDVFETFNCSDPEIGQNGTDRYFRFGSGKFRFKRMTVTDNSYVLIESGAEVRVSDHLSIGWSGVIYVQPGGKFILEATEDNICKIENYNVGLGVQINGVYQMPIEGEVTREMVFDMAVVSETDYDNQRVAQWNFNPGLYDVNMDAVIRQLQDSMGIAYLDGTEKPDIQISYLTKSFTDDPEYGYTIQHQYSDFNSGSLQDPNDFTDFVKDYEYGAYVANWTAHYDTLGIPSNGPFVFDWDVRQGILPIYRNNDNNAVTFNNEEAFTSFLDGTTIIDEIAQQELATYSKAWAKPMVISVVGADYDKTSCKIEVTGKYDPRKGLTIKNRAALPNLEVPILFSQDQEQGSTYFARPSLTANSESSMSVLHNAPVSMLDNGEAATLYRGIDMGGFNVLYNRTGNHLVMKGLAKTIRQTNDHAALAFYDVRGMHEYMPDRSWELGYNDPGTSSQWFGNTSALNDMPRVVSQFIQVPTIPSLYLGYPVTLFDIYAIPGLNYHHSVGDTLHANDVIGYNFVNAGDAVDLDGQQIQFSLSASEGRYCYKDRVGPPGSTLCQDLPEYPYADEPAGYDPYPVKPAVKEAGLRTSASVLVGNESDVTANVFTQEVDLLDPNFTPDADFWNETQSIGLMRFAGITAFDDTVTLAMIPVGYNSNWSDTELDIIERQTMPNSMFYLLNPNYNGWANRRMGAYCRGTDDPFDTITVVINDKAIVDEGVYTSYIIDCPITQEPNNDWSDNWHFIVSGAGSNQRLDNPDFEIVYNPGPVTITAPYGGNDESFTGQTFDLITSPLYGDYNYDLCVSTSDLLIFLGSFGLSGNDITLYDADASEDGYIGVADLLQNLQYFGICLDDLVGEPEEWETPINERVKMLHINHDNDFQTYDIVDDYPGWSASQRAELSAATKALTTIIVSDEFGLHMHAETGRLNDIRGLQLDSYLPTSAELANYGGTGDANYPPAYQLHIYFRDGILFNGSLTTEIHVGGQEPNAPFPTAPIFTAN